MENVYNLTCPICSEKFSDVHLFAEHMAEHSELLKKQEAENAKQSKEAERKKDVKRLETLYSIREKADNDFKIALDEYNKKYGGLIFEFDNSNNFVTGFLNKILYL